ncbi:MAG: hypothetical protein JXA33_16925 [Anaerolineae bacterium]|nr:hypothetical protein [Anaerolineae bacterium]
MVFAIIGGIVVLFIGLVVGGYWLGQGNGGAMSFRGCGCVLGGIVIFAIIAGLLLSLVGVKPSVIVESVSTLWQRLIYQTPTPELTPLVMLPHSEATATPLPTPDQCWNAKLITDESTPEHTQVEPGTTFTTTWHVRNIGHCDWEGVELHLLDGASMEAKVIPVSNTRAGSETKIIAQMIAPNQEGRYYSIWQYVTGNHKFGMLTVTIEVQAE